MTESKVKSTDMRKCWEWLAFISEITTTLLFALALGILKESKYGRYAFFGSEDPLPMNIPEWLYNSPWVLIMLPLATVFKFVCDYSVST